MADYRAPLADMTFALNEVAGMAQIAQLPGYEDATPDMVSAILEEAGKLSGEVLAPLNDTGDRAGVKLTEQHEVPTPAGFKEAYQQFAEGGWGSLQFDPEYGGQGMPKLLATPVMEMWQAANMSWGLCPLLSQGAIEALEANACDAVKQTYIPRLISGEWTGTMNLTEPQAGSDLAAIRSKAEREGDHYRISGQKIFITWGEHDFTDNIVHLVLARLPDAPAGVKGISLFVVPKFLVNEDGSLGERNDVKAVSLEHKMGIHASPTCVMSFGDEGGAIGYLVGEENKGIACMFTMMNNARLGVGLQGVAIADRAYQHAVTYARERVQSPAPGTREAGPIIKHPDVRRMLLTMRSLTEAARALTYVAHAGLDYEHAGSDEQKAAQKARVALLTPIVKGWGTEIAQEVTALGVQVHGGMGFIEETGAAQFQRDARILPIYEGTNGIQAMDLVGRKTLFDQGAAMHNLLAEMRELIVSAEGSAFETEAAALAAGIEAMELVQASLLNGAADDANLAGSIAFNYLMLAGTLCGGWLMLKSALAAAAKADAGDSDPFYQAKQATARFYFQQILPRYLGYAAICAEGSDAVMALDEALF
ncbi:acyl-CoA dehydrogenase C-terminal domain-containing protein [Motiliproteus sediminis]|uniref:acyl-CoA dehydrogenase C-terminal domain-containing protein n=1 Tax=Motiliproteus sediminis TaxID=1468178 RepID=UPI001AEF8221|nr:acyl-CoA dehydrogenase C-terminal domain-containing protein [Motiliproteus sediminis]